MRCASDLHGRGAYFTPNACKSQQYTCHALLPADAEGGVADRLQLQRLLGTLMSVPVAMPVGAECREGRITSRAAAAEAKAERKSRGIGLHCLPLLLLRLLLLRLLLLHLLLTAATAAAATVATAAAAVATKPAGAQQSSIGYRFPLFGPCAGAAVIDWVSVFFDPLVGPCAGTAVILWVCYSWQWL